MIEAIIYNKPAVMGLVSPFSDVNMIIGEEAVMLIHETLHSLTYTYVSGSAFIPCPLS